MKKICTPEIINRIKCAIVIGINNDVLSVLQLTTVIEYDGKKELIYEQ